MLFSPLERALPTVAGAIDPDKVLYNLLNDLIEDVAAFRSSAIHAWWEPASTSCGNGVPLDSVKQPAWCARP
ncbi:hypothetical protein PsorP6_017362 [Peronosclerospora sorghi]|uniref:Uncharacterized protein n=1 Tax=Peronosclerospora sorghi TaxID=230839 RepID=A0ACC0WNF4_9STRA|nr:hypothetical protein PsorP6_017362 [Peronosclerospora sorghi]